MEPDFFISEPIAFNCFKHHRQFILNALKNEPYEEVKTRLNTLNNNYIDIYTGSLHPSAICAEIKQFLIDNRIVQKAEFEKWIANIGGFSIIQLSDQSVWILRLGTNSNKFVHIHPSKSGLFSERLKGSTLKTFLLIHKQKAVNLSNPTTAELNFIRKEAGLSPIKRREPGRGLQKAKDLFT